MRTQAAIAVTLALLLGACGSQSHPPAGGVSTTARSAQTATQTTSTSAQSTAERVKRQAELGRRQSEQETSTDRLDAEVDRAVRRRARAAKRADRAGVAAAERELNRLARQIPPQKASADTDAFEQAQDQIAFKQAPLYVEQMISTQGDRTLYLGINRDAFCLLAPDARLSAIQAVYGPAQRTLTQAGIRDLQLIVTPVTNTEPKRSRALAIGNDGRVTLTARGRRC